MANAVVFASSALDETEKAAAPLTSVDRQALAFAARDCP
jgi:hypothetical protein